MKHSNEFGIKIYNRLVKQYPQLSTDQYKSYKGPYGQGPKKGPKEGGSQSKPVIKNPNKVKNNSNNKIKKDKLGKMPSPQGPIGGYMNGPGIAGYQDMGGYDNTNIYYGNINHTKQQSSNVNISININANFPTPQKDNYFSYKPQNYYQTDYQQ